MRKQVPLVLALAALAVIVVPRVLPPEAPPSRATRRVAHVGTARDGVWIWTKTDAEVFEGRGGSEPEALPGVLVWSFDLDARGELLGRRGLSPAVTGSRPFAAVVRIEDAVAPRLDDPARLAADLDARIAPLRAELDASTATLAEVQLDFDVPVRSLGGWADVARALGEGSLRGVPIWVTSLPSHLAVESYGALFDHAVAGHLFQVFDTGLPCNEREVARAGEHLGRAHLPFRVGVATFERAREGRRTSDHGCWARAARGWSKVEGASGAWVFPAGKSTALAFTSLQGDR